MDAIIHDLLVGLPLLLWVLFVVFFISKWVGERYSVYRARKAIHYFAGGLVALLAPFIFETPYIISLASFFLFIFTYLPHAMGKRFHWFQIEGLYGEVYFCFSYFVLFSIFWDLDVWIAVTAALFMAFGDGITGVVKEIVYKRRVKGFTWGNVAMLLVTLPIGLVLKGIPGAIAAVYASLIEGFEGIDDNVTIPLGSAAIMWLLR